MILERRAEGEEDVRKRGPGGADKQNGTASIAIGKPAPDGRENELHGRIGGHDDTDSQALSPEGLDAIRHQVLAINRHQRNNDPKSDEINEHRQENNKD